MIKENPVVTPVVFQSIVINRPRPPSDISTTYVDGFSVTHERNSRHHIWIMSLLLLALLVKQQTTIWGN